ncbi:hypothetical protein X975_07449, partial [Stegodyphus mimosarum]
DLFTFIWQQHRTLLSYCIISRSVISICKELNGSMVLLLILSVDKK